MIRTSAVIRAQPDRVYAALADVESWPAVLARVARVDLLYRDSRHQEVRLHVRQPHGIEPVREVRFLYPERRIEFFRPEPPPGVSELRGVWSIEPLAAGGTLVRAAVSFCGERLEGLERQLIGVCRQDLDRLQRLLESGETAQPTAEGQPVSSVSDEPASAALMRLICGQFCTQLVAAAAHLGLADQLVRGPLGAAEVARASGTQPDATYRLMRALSAVGVLHEHVDQKFSLSPVGECLRSDLPGSLAPMAKFLGEGWHSAVWSELMSALRSGESPFRKVHGSSVFQWFAAHPKEAATFNDAMTSFGALTAQAVVAAYDFSYARKIVDVGGGHGRLLAEILSSNPRASGVLFDLTHVTAGAPLKLADQGLAQRCEIAGGDFFEAVPEGADTYILQQIVHDWPDEPAVSILKNVVRAMNADGRVLIVEQVVPAPGVPHFTKLLDVEMLLQTEGGRERTEREYGALLEQAGLKLERVIAAPPSDATILEAVRFPSRTTS
jgi:ribosome-associated toxin RatA of RatAB toxin-antitoxin module